ncbi:retrovirus-related pol polyprotein from transposon TNT 1-94 [Tanacetum coccineum]
MVLDILWPNGMKDNGVTREQRNVTEISGWKEEIKLYDAFDNLLNIQGGIYFIHPGIPAAQAQIIIPHNDAFQTEDLDTYDSDCDDLSTTQAVLMANISNYGSDIISKVQNLSKQIKEKEYEMVGTRNYLAEQKPFWFHKLNPTIEPPYTPPVIVDVPKRRSEVKEEDNNLMLSEEEYFEINDLKARLQDKYKNICKLMDTIKSLRENTKEENINHNKWEIEPINKELENSVAKLLSENERLCNEINHVKQVFKDQFDSIKQTCVRHKEQRKEIVENVAHTPSATTIDPGMFKLNLEPLPPRLLQNREVHIDYLRNTQEQANILQEIVEQAKAKQPLDSELDLACKYATRIQELLVYVQDTCPNAIIPSAKKVTVKPMNNVKKVRFAKPLTSSSNIKQVESSNTSDSNTPVLSSTGVKCSTSNCGSKPLGNKRNDRISQTPSRNKKNKVEAQPRKVNKVNRVVKPVCDVDVKHSLSKANSKILCAICNKFMFDGVHDKCLHDLVQNGNKRTKSAKKHIKQNIWKPTGHVFTDVGFKWKPIGRIFTIVCNSCPLTRITSTNVVQIVLWYLDSGCSKHMTGNRSQLMNFVSKFLGTVRFGNDQIARIMGYGDYQLGNVIISRVYYVEGLGHNLFSVGQFCDADLEVAFWKNTCFIRNLEGVDLLSGSRDTNLYTISLDDMLKSSPICLLSKASKTKSWLWHRRLSHLNFGTLNKLAKDGLARGIPRLKFQKDHFLCKATVQNVRTYNGTKIFNQTLREWYENVGITNQTSVARTPQQNGVVERRNRTLVEAARTMLIFSKASLFLWAEAINIACYTQNRHGFQGMTPATSNIGLGSNPVSQQPCLPPIRDDWDRLFQPMFDEYFNPPIRPDHNHAVCLCARYQAKPTKKHLQAVKPIFRYLNGTINMGLWYSNDTYMSLTAYADADHAGCQDTRRSAWGSA